jgi:hypothetical protein
MTISFELRAHARQPGSLKTPGCFHPSLSQGYSKQVRNGRDSSTSMIQRNDVTWPWWSPEPHLVFRNRRKFLVVM